MTENYVFANTQQAQEWERLSAVQDEFDPMTHQHLERLGVSSGWSCLEVGAGAGSIMKWLCDRVGEHGRVVAVDLDPRYVKEIQLPNLEVRRLDIAATEVEASSFDLVHARFVLMHIPERQRAISHMVQALKPGGWLLLEDADFITAMPADKDTPEAPAIERVLEATRQLYFSMGIDPFMGRKLPLILQDLSLNAISTKGEIALVQGGSRRAKIWRMAVEHLRQRLMETGIASATDINQFIRLTDETTAWMLDYTAVSAWGQKNSSVVIDSLM